MHRRNLLLTAIATLPAMRAFASDAPPIKLIVPFAPGGSADFIARLIAVPLSPRLEQPVVVENKAGAGSTIGTAAIAQASPDGLTLGIAAVSGMATGPATMKVGYDPHKDFTAITNICATPSVIAVNPSFPATNFQEFLQVVRKNPGKYSYATSGPGSVGNLQMELFKQLADLRIVHIPYTGASQALTGVISGQGAEIIFDQLPSIRNHVVAKKLIPVALASSKQLPMPFNIPTLKELGFERANRMSFFGLIAPAGLKQEVLARISKAMDGVLHSDTGTRRKLEDAGSFVIGNTPQQFQEQISSEYKTYADLVKRLNLTI